MNKTRICHYSLFDKTSGFVGYNDTNYLEDTYYFNQYNSYKTLDATKYLSAYMAVTNNRSDIMKTRPTTLYSLKGQPLHVGNINYIALNRTVIPATARLTLYMWNLVDWGSSPMDYTTGYTAKFSADNIGQATGWGTFDWGSPWAGTKPITEINPMSSTIMLWFDETRYGYNLTNESDIVLPNKTVQDVLRWKLEIDFENGTPGRQGSFQSERINFGEYMELDYNMTHGHSITYQDSTKQSRTIGGSLMTDFSSRFKQLKASFPVVSATDRIKLSELFARVGTHKDIIVSIYPKNAVQQLEIDYTIAGKFRKIPVLTNRIGGFYKTSFELLET